MLTYFQRKCRFFSNLLVAIAAMLSLCAAFCTVSGLYSLFGKSVMVAVIVAFIEMARVSAVYTLHEFWHDVKERFKWIGIIFVTIGTIISSAGIMGFFANSYGEMTFETAQLSAQSEGQSAVIKLARESIQFEQENLARLESQLKEEQANYNKLKNTNEDGSLTSAQRQTQNRINNLRKEINTANKNIRAEKAKIDNSSTQITNLTQESMAKSPELASFGIIGKAIGIKDTSVLVWVLIIMVTSIFDLFAIFLWIWSSKIRQLGHRQDEVVEEVVVEKKEKTPSIRLFKKKEPKIKVEKEEEVPVIIEEKARKPRKIKKSKKIQEQPLAKPEKRFTMSSIKQVFKKKEKGRKDLFSEFVN